MNPAEEQKAADILGKVRAIPVPDGLCDGMSIVVKQKSSRFHYYIRMPELTGSENAVMRSIKEVERAFVAVKATDPDILSVPKATRIARFLQLRSAAKELTEKERKEDEAAIRDEAKLIFGVFKDCMDWTLSVPDTLLDLALDARKRGDGQGAVDITELPDEIDYQEDDDDEDDDEDYDEDDNDSLTDDDVIVIDDDCPMKDDVIVIDDD
jgi:hypothetical protein